MVSFFTDFPPEEPKDLSGKAVGNMIQLQWTAPDYTDNIAKYVVKYHVKGENSIPLEVSTMYQTDTGTKKKFKCKHYSE